jgi:PAS domain S-box-containing protein
MRTDLSERLTALIVDDDQKVRELLVDILAGEGYDVISAENGIQALRLANSFEPDVVVSDVVMPEMDGIELCREIKRNPRTASVPVLLISGLRNSTDEGIEGLTAGADDYLNLPFPHQELLVKIARLTERHRIEKHYREIVEQAADIIYTRSLDGYITSINGAGARFFGIPAHELVGKHLSQLIGPKEAALDIVETRKLNSDSSVRLVRSLKDARGQTRYLEGLHTVQCNRSGEPVGVRGVVRDITEQRVAEESLRESEERYRELFENANEIIYTHDLSGKFTSLNKAGERITGYSLEEALKMNIADVLAPEHLGLAQQMTRKVTGEVLAFHELEIISKVGQRLRLEVSTRLFYKDGVAAGVQGIARDLTERRLAEQTLAEQSQREAMTHRISQAVRRSFDSSEIFHTAVQELGSQLNVDYCCLLIEDERSKRAVNVAEYHAAGVQLGDTDFELESLKGLTRKLDQNGVLAVDDADDEAYARFLGRTKPRSLMYVAIRVGDEVPAVFALARIQSQRHWTEADIGLTTAVADQTGIAIRQSQLYQRAQATSSREALVNRLSMAIHTSLSLRDVLDTVTRELGVALDASRVHLHLYSPDDPVTPVEHRYVAPGCSTFEQVEISYDDPVGRYLWQSSKPLVIDDAFNCAEGPSAMRVHLRSQAERLGVLSTIYCPVIVKGLFRGTLCIHQTDRTRNWTDDELALVDAVAARLATGIAQAELFEMVARAKTEWETTFDAMSEGIFIFDQSGRLKRVNRAGAGMENVHPRALLGRKCCDILRTREEDDGCVVEKALNEARSVTVEVTPKRFNRPLLVTVELMLDADGKVTAFVCTARDLSELRKAEAVAREHQSLLTNILESARESIYAVDTEGHFKWCNTATLGWLGYRREELIGRHVLDMVYDDDQALVKSKLRDALDGQPQTYEMRYFAHDGQLRYARVDNSPLVVEGQTTGVLGIARDITEQKAERERAAQADKLRALGQLASGVAHDFNNSLAAILGRAQLLQRQTRDEAVVRNLDIIQTAAQDAANTVHRIQTFARQSPVREFEILELRALLNDAIEITRTRWEYEARVRGLNYDVSLAAEEAQLIFGNASELREVFVNLIVNAVDAMPSGGQLSIDCVSEGTRLKLRFSDSGTGMPEDVRQKIFDPFFSTKGALGTGLGLSVSYGIIERHEGSIRVESELRKGTVFTIDLPGANAESSGKKAVLNVSSTPPLSVLVIDDEPSVRETLADMLTALNHMVTIAESGREALQHLAARNFDLVLTDLAMPEMNGWQTACEIRRIWPDMKIVLVTGYGVGTEPPPGEERLVDAIIGKPFDFTQVSEAINLVVSRRAPSETEALQRGRLAKRAPSVSPQNSGAGSEIITLKLIVQPAAREAEFASGASDVASMSPQSVGDHAAFNFGERIGERDIVQ